MPLPVGLVSRKFAAPSAPLPPGTKRDLIVLHYTEGGTASGAVSWWQTQYRESGNKTAVGTAFVVDRDGTIYEVFDHKTRWAWHLGINDGTQDRRAIGIEFVCWGGLLRDKVTGRLYPASQAKRDRKTWTWIDEGDLVQVSLKPEEANRGQQRLQQRFTAKQYASGLKLVNELCSGFGIPRRIPPLEKRNVLDLAWFRGWTGIASHQNCSAQRLDIGPAWDWSVFGV
jgi:N-acetyl-anhydromuramyl-L-alanine amidase AmpD